MNQTSKFFDLMPYYKCILYINMYIYIYMLILYIFLQVTDTKGHTLYSKEDAKKGKFAFTTEEYDMFEVCFESKMVGGMSIVLYTSMNYFYRRHRQIYLFIQTHLNFILAWHMFQLINK